MNPLLKKFITDVIIQIVIGLFLVFFVQLRWQLVLRLIIRLLIITEIFRWVPEKNMSLLNKIAALAGLCTVSAIILMTISKVSYSDLRLLCLFIICAILRKVWKERTTENEI